jgi:hypothetical protein
MILDTIFILLMWVSIGDFTQEADALLKNYVQDGKVDYRALADDTQSLEALYQQIGEVSLEGVSDTEKKAFYVNAYNIITIYQVVQHYPVSSPMDIPGFFDKIKHQVAGETFTLNELEKGRLFKQYFDPRLHFVLVCAAESCPQLVSYAYQPDKLDRQLEERTRQVLNDPDFIRLKPAKNEVAVSKIFEWYGEDFLQEAPSLAAYINRYREKPIPSRYDVSFYEYSWQLNQP